MLPRPAVVEQAGRAVARAVALALLGERGAAREALSTIDDRAIREWCSDVLPRAAAQRARLGRARSLRWAPSTMPIGRREPPLAAALTTEVFERDRYRCRFCDADVLEPDHLRRLQELVGDDALGPDRGSWISALATVDRVRPLGRAATTDPAHLVTACGPCAGAIGRRPLAALGLDDPRERPPAAVSDWWPLVAALGQPAGRRRAMVEQAIVLDGSTLNVGGVLVGGAPPVGALSLEVRSEAGAVVAPIELLGPSIGGWQFQAHASLVDVVAAAAPRSPLLLQLVGDPDGPLALTPLAGFASTPNSDVTEPIPIIASLGRRLAFDVGRELRLQVHQLRPAVEVAGVRDRVGDLEIELRSSPAGAATVTSVWLQHRGDDDGDRVLLTDARDGTWRLAPGAWIGAVGAVDGALWDVWATWEAGGQERSARVGRRDDLVAPRAAVRLPRVQLEVDGVRVGATPYYTISRHLAVKITHPVRPSAVPT